MLKPMEKIKLPKERIALVAQLKDGSLTGMAKVKASKRVVELVCDALQMALWKRQRPCGVIVHSDRGSQYCSSAYQSLIARHQLRGSMSARGNCYDNACAESFFHSLKVEAIHGERFRTRESMRQAVFEYIEIDYNRQRRHSTNGYLSPEAFEALNIA